MDKDKPEDNLFSIQGVQIEGINGRILEFSKKLNLEISV